MILFIFEGGVREPALYKTMKYLFLSDSIKDDIIVSYCSNIYSLYQKMKELDAFDDDIDSADIVQVLKEQLANSPNPQDDELNKIENSDSISEVYLFFDYDLKKKDDKNKLSVEEQNSQINELLEYFDNETEHGKLFIDYPMVESIRYFKKELPDEDYVTYVTDMFIGKGFKKEAGETFYKNFDFISFNLNKNNDLKIPLTMGKTFDFEKINLVKTNWLYIKELNVKKANYICSGNNEFPDAKDEISQQKIFDGQVKKYLPDGNIAILNSFPLFLYEYLR
ncbi:hypothetical protein [Treponema sp.]|uniref:hypothetical protein n=1 Tax=Treponema sp. TaxID=166 RepID=UPI00298DAD0D|nr:hypothetical protein [Treponema sp.]MCQ2242454.1 hypothetical protein [Treponema sp.]